jgi:hypothetical protein
LASLPPFDIQDAKLMKIAEDFAEYKTPEALLAALPKVKPIARGTLFQPTKHEGHWKFDGGLFSTIPKFEWHQLYNLTDAEAKASLSVELDEEELIEC